MSQEYVGPLDAEYEEEEGEEERGEKPARRRKPASKKPKAKAVKKDKGGAKKKGGKKAAPRRAAGESDDKLVWEEPPAGKSQRDYKALLEPVKKQAGKWARILTVATPNYASSVAMTLRAGKRELPTGKFEFRSARLQDGRGGVWAKFVGRNGGGK